MLYLIILFIHISSLQNEINNNKKLFHIINYLSGKLICGLNLLTLTRVFRVKNNKQSIENITSTLKNETVR